MIYSFQLYFLAISQSFVFFAVFMLIGLFCFSTNGQNIEVGMSQDDAVDVAIESLRKTAAFVNKPRKPANENIRKELRNWLRRKVRIHETLESLGINDATRLNAAKLYLVRNKRLGTQSVWRYDNENGILQYYTIRYEDLKDLTSENTLGELASLLTTKSGYYSLPIQQAKTLVEKCRQKSHGQSVNLQEIPTSKKLNEETNDVTAFKQCLEVNKMPESAYWKKPKSGMLDTTIREPDGKLVPYWIPKNEDYSDVTYKQILERLTKKAYVATSKRDLATRIAIHGILQTLAEEYNSNENLPCFKGSGFDKLSIYLIAKLRNYTCSGATVTDAEKKHLRTIGIASLRSFRLFTLFKTINSTKTANEKKDRLTHISVDPEILKKVLVKLSTEAANNKYYFRKHSSDNTMVVTFGTNEFDGITSETSIREVIDAVKNALEKQKIGK